MADNAFSIDASPSQDSVDTARRKKISALGLQGLSQYANEPDSESLSEQPLYGGNLSKASSISEEAEEPSQLATERVVRAPSSEVANPLLAPEERLGNIATGEEGTYGPLSNEQRGASLKDFFNSGNRGEEPGQPDSQGGATSGAMSRNVGGAGAKASMAIGSAKTANTAGTKLGKSLADLFSTGGVAGAGASFPSGLSLGGTPTAPGEFPIDPSGFDFSAPDAGSSLNPADYSLGADAGGAGGSIGGYIGAVGAGVSGALSIAQLINGLVNGTIDTSKTGAVPKTVMNVGVAALPILETLIPGLTGLTGLGLAATPMLIPAIMDLVNSFKEPNFPEVAGQKTHGLSDYKSAMTAEALVPQIEAWINQNADNPQALLSLAQQGSFGPGGEVNFGGTSLQDLINNPTDEALRNFVGGASFTSGATGRGLPNAHLTDTYRRTLAHALGFTPEQAQGLFGADQYGGFGSQFEQMIAPQNPFHVGPTPIGSPLDLQQVYNDLPNYASGDFSNFGGYSPYYRDPAAGRLSPDQVSQYQALIQQIMNYNQEWEPILRAQAQASSLGDGGGDGGGGF